VHRLKEGWDKLVLQAKLGRSIPLAKPVLLAGIFLFAACAPVPPTAPQATPTGPLIPKEQAIQLGQEICNSGRVASASKPTLDAAELTTNQAIAKRLGRKTWADLPADSPIWLVRFNGAFSVARPPGGSSGNAQALGPFPACWAIIEARTGARGTVYIPEK
jgi:hypothetical protein